MVVLPIHSVVYLRNFVITIYGSPTNPFGSIFEELVSLQNMVVLPIHSVVYLWNYKIFLPIITITIYGSPTYPFSSIFEEFCHYKIW